MKETVAPLLTVDEAAEILKVKRQQVYQIIREGILPAVRLGKTIRIDSNKLQEWINNGGQQYEGGWRKQAVQ